MYPKPKSNYLRGTMLFNINPELIYWPFNNHHYQQINECETDVNVNHDLMQARIGSSKFSRFSDYPKQ